MTSRRIPTGLETRRFLSPSGQKRPVKITQDMVVAFLYGFEGSQVENQVFATCRRPDLHG
jgi:hypothetical protein